MAFFNTQSKKRPLLRIPALATHREVQVSREAGCRERPAFVHPAQHGFCFASFFKHFSVFEKSAGSGFSRQPRRGLAQGCVKQKWRYIPIPRRAGSPSAAIAQGGARAATAG